MAAKQPTPAEANVALAIKDNNCAGNDPCALCGARTDQANGPTIFLADSYEVVCDDCARMCAPWIVEARDHAAQVWNYELKQTALEANSAPADANPFAQDPPRWVRFDPAKREAERAQKRAALREAWAALPDGQQRLPVGTEDVTGALIAMLDAANETLNRGPEACNRLGLQELERMGFDLGALYHNLAQTEPALRLLAKVRDSLGNRAVAIAEVTGLEFDRGYFVLDTPGALLDSDAIPERWRPVVADDGDIPF